MARIYITKLNTEVKKNLLQKNYSVDQVLQVKESVNQILDNRKKGMRLAMILGAAVVVMILVMTAMTMGLNKAFWVVSGMTAGMVILIFVLVWYLNLGLIKGQYNGAVKKAYPDDAERLCIK